MNRDEYRLIDSELVRALITFPVLDDEGTHLLQKVEPVASHPGMWWVALWVKQPEDMEPAITYGILDQLTWEALPPISDEVMDLANLGASIEQEVIDNPDGGSGEQEQES